MLKQLDELQSQILALYNATGDPHLVVGVDIQVRFEGLLELDKRLGALRASELSTRKGGIPLGARLAMRFSLPIDTATASTDELSAAHATAVMERHRLEEKGEGNTPAHTERRKWALALESAYHQARFRELRDNLDPDALSEHEAWLNERTAELDWALETIHELERIAALASRGRNG